MASAGPDDLEGLIDELPPDLREEVADYARALLERRDVDAEEGPDEIGFSWAGALRHLRDEYTSVELQEKARGLWGN